MFARDYNDILNEILTTYRNMGPVETLNIQGLKEHHPDIYNQFLIQGEPDTSVGSVLYMDAAVLASILYGIYKTHDKVVDQFFSDTAERQNLDRQAADFGIVSSGMTDAQLRASLDEVKKLRLMGGNRFDYDYWARSCRVDDEFVISTLIRPLAQGEGTFDIVITGNKNNGVPSDSLLNAVIAMIEENRTVGSGFSWGLRIVGSVLVEQDVSITDSTPGFDRVRAADDIAAYIKSLKPGQTLYRSQLGSICIQLGAANPAISVPAADVVPEIDVLDGVYSKLWPGDIEVL
ncbi:MAG TPA: baseplate J/gp47 family protein [Chitinispirillaceae bacterium]|nr:baseplate J/gp47 family protein [Chitinispirillaceae bacterium]